MSACTKSGFLKFESANDFEGLHIFARIHFGRGPTTLVNKKTSPLFALAEESTPQQQIFAK